MTRGISNEVANKVTYAGTETINGTAATPDFRLLGQYTANETASLNRTEEVTGGYDRLITPARTPSTFDGTYANPKLTYEELSILAQYFLRRGATGVSDAETTPGYTYDKFPDFDTDDIASFTAQHYVDGLGFQNTGVRFPEWTIGADADSAEGAWSFNGSLYFRSNEILPGYFFGLATGGTGTTLVMTGAAWTINQYAGSYLFNKIGSHIGDVRLILSNTADTLTVDEAFDTTPIAGDEFYIAGDFPAGIALPQWHTIEQYGTELILAPTFADLDTADPVAGRIISWNVTGTQELTAKRFLDNAINEVSDKVGKGPRFVTVAVRFEFDRPDEWFQWRNTEELALRFRQIGPVIDDTVTPDPTTHLAQITIPRAAWDTFSPDERGTNLTATFGALAYRHATEPIVDLTTVTTLATLP